MGRSTHQVLDVANEAHPVLCRLAIGSASDVVQIEAEASRIPWSEAAVCDEFEREHSIIFGARLSGGLIGFLIVHSFLDEAHIVNFAVRPAFQGLGVGRRLLIFVLGELAAKAVKSITLEVRGSNTAARRLYQKLGFCEVGLRTKYYSDNGEDALILKLDLTQFMVEHGQQFAEL